MGPITSFAKRISIERELDQVDYHGGNRAKREREKGENIRLDQRESVEEVEVNRTRRDVTFIIQMQRN